MAPPAVLVSMVRKDLLRQLRQPLGMLLILAFPVIFSALLALTFGSSGETMPRVDLLVENDDDGFLSGLLVGALQQDRFAAHARVTVVDDGDARMERGEASALLRIPPGFTRAMLDGDPVTLELVRNPAQSILPEIAEQMFAVAADVLDTAARVLREPLDGLGAMAGSPDGPSESEVLRMASEVYRTIERSEALVFPPVIAFESVQLDDPDGRPDAGAGVSVFLLILPGISVWALFTLGDVAMRDVLRETTAGTLRRQLTSPLTARDVVVGKALYTAVVALISLAILAALGAAMLERPVSVAGFGVLSLALIVAVTGFSALIYGLARTERQGATVSSVVMLGFAFVGGSFVPLSSMPAGVQSVAPLSPFYWGVSGFNRLIVDGAGASGVAVNAGVLAALGVVTLLAGSRFLAAGVRGGRRP